MSGWLKETPMTCGFSWERRLSVLVRAKAPEKNVIPFHRALQTILQVEAKKSKQNLLCGPPLLIEQVM